MPCTSSKVNTCHGSERDGDRPHEGSWLIVQLKPGTLSAAGMEGFVGSQEFRTLQISFHPGMEGSLGPSISLLPRTDGRCSQSPSQHC